jgi:hypothetical protein
MFKSAEDGTLPQDCLAAFEKALIEEFLGHPLSRLDDMPSGVASALMRSACLFASLRLEEMSARSHCLQSIHGTISASRSHLVSL